MKNNNIEEILFVVLGIVVAIGFILLFAAGLSALGALLFCWAWNTFAVSVFHAPAISFLQAFAGLMLVSSLKGIFSFRLNKE